MSAIVLNIEAIVSDPAVRGGEPVISGTGLRVIDVVAYHRYAGQTAEELAVGFSLSLGQVYAALAYYHLHKDDLDAQMRADAQQAEQQIEILARQGRLIRLE